MVLGAQVLAYDNVALNKSTSASPSGWGWVAERAVDGLVGEANGYHSVGAGDEWLEVDLDGVFYIDSIEVEYRAGAPTQVDGVVFSVLDANRHVMAKSDPVSGSPPLWTWDNRGNGFQSVSIIRAEKSGDFLMVMELRAFGEPGYGHPAWEPAPGDGDTMVEPDTVLEWNTGLDAETMTVPNPAITAHNVYMSSATDPNLRLVDTIDADGATGQYDPQGLARGNVGIVYSWRIDEVAGPNVIKGNVWSFTTRGASPEIDAAAPVSILVAPGSEATFSVSVINPFTDDNTGMTYQWYKVGDPTVRSTSDTYVIPNVQNPDDKGSYYCTVTLTDNGKTTTSGVAVLYIKDLVGHWKFEDNADDSSGLGYHGTPMGVPAYADGIDGRAIDLDGLDDYVDVPVSIMDQFLGTEITFSLWTNFSSPAKVLTAIGGWDDVGNRAFSAHTPWNDWNVYWDSGDATGFDRIYGWVDYNAVLMNQWSHWAFTKNSVTGEMKIYRNGVLFQSGTGLTRELGEVTALNIGRSAAAAGEEFDGLMDDVRLYNYELDPISIAQMYTAIAGGSICVEASPLDLTGDCKVTLDDFIVLLATDWMTCNRVPTSQCE